MKKEYYNEERANYIIEKLHSTKIDEVYKPLIVDIILRRRFEHNLDDKLFYRDVNTFIKNVKKISVGNLPKGISGRISHSKKRIWLSEQMFKGPNIDFLKIYQVLAHECIHGMNFESEGMKNEDRTFPHGKSLNSTGILEIFTECEAHSLTYNENYRDPQLGNSPISKTKGYPSITPYVDLIAASFGIKKKELLSAAVKGNNELHNLLNRCVNKANPISGKNLILQKMSLNLSFLHSELYKKNQLPDIDNIQDANEKIYASAEECLLTRIANMPTNNMDEFKEGFEQIKLDQRIIRTIIEAGCGKLLYTEQEIKQLTEKTGSFLVDIKLRYIEEILRSRRVEDKTQLLQVVQKSQNIKDIIGFMNSSAIRINLEQELPIAYKTIQEYNMEQACNGAQWDNDNNKEYIQKHLERMKEPNLTKFERFKQWLNKKFNLNGNEVKLLPEVIDSDKVEEHSWDLSNWGIDKEEFMIEHAKNMQEYNSREPEPEQRTTQKEELTIHSGHEHGIIR